MGKKKGGEKVEEEKARAFTLKVAMHCNCNGCIDKIRAAVKDITRIQGIESWDQSAVESKGELRLLATADPEKLRLRLHKATRKHVDLIFPSKEKEHKADKDAASASVQALLNSLQVQVQQGNNQPLLVGAGYGYYPSWGVQQPDPYAAYPAATWGHGNGAYGWHGHGAY